MRRKEIQRLLKLGKTPREIKDLIPGVHGAEIWIERRVLGMSPFNRGRPVGSVAPLSARILRMYELHKGGMTCEAIGKKFGITHQGVSHNLRWHDERLKALCATKPSSGDDKL